MTFRGSANSRSTVHPSMGSPANDTRPLCCARCRRGTLATGLGPCGYDNRCRCHAEENWKAQLAEMTGGTNDQ